LIFFIHGLEKKRAKRNDAIKKNESLFFNLMVIFRESKIIIHTKNSFSGIKIQFLLILNSQNLKINCRPICAWCNKHKCGVKCGYL